MNILSYNPGHDGAFAYLEDGQLVASVESEKKLPLSVLSFGSSGCVQYFQ